MVRFRGGERVETEGVGGGAIAWSKNATCTLAVIAAVLLVVGLGGCGFAVGHFRHTGQPARVVTGTIVHQSCSGGQCSTTGTSQVTVSDRVSLAIGVLDGYARSSIKNERGVSGEQSGLDLHVYLDFHYHITPRFTFALDGGIDLQNWDDATLMKLGLDAGSGYLAIGGIGRGVFTTSDTTQVWIGGGYMSGGVDTVDASNIRANVGFHHALTRIDTLHAVLLFRADAYATVWGANSFSQQTVLGGFCFWFRSD